MAAESQLADGEASGDDENMSPEGAATGGGLRTWVAGTVEFLTTPSRWLRDEPLLDQTAARSDSPEERELAQSSFFMGAERAAAAGLPNAVLGSPDAISGGGISDPDRQNIQGYTVLEKFSQSVFAHKRRHEEAADLSEPGGYQRRLLRCVIYVQRLWRINNLLFDHFARIIFSKKDGTCPQPN